MNVIAFIRHQQSSLWLCFLCLLLTGNLAIGQAGFGLFEVASEMDDVVQRAFMRPVHFSDRPGPVFRGDNPGRDPIGRGGMWTESLRADLRKAREREAQERPIAPVELMATVTPVVPSLLGQEPPPTTSGGGSGPGEGGGPGGTAGGGESTTTGGGTSGGLTGGEQTSNGGGGELNTNTGNRHSAYPIVGWSARGQNGVNFALHHNSKGAYSFDLGKGWSHSYDVKITHNSGTSAIIRYGDGMEVPYTESSGVFTPPAGYHDDLVLNGGGTWTLTTTSQWVYGFDTNGRLVTVTDRNGNVTTISRNGSGKPTSISDGTGRTLDFTYTGGGLIETITDPMERVWELTYNGSNQMTDITYPELDSTFYDRSFTYNAASDILTETDRRGKTWTYTYDGSENLLTITNPLSKTWTWSYTSTAATLTDPYSKTVVHNYSGGMIASAVDKASYSVGLVYDGDKNVTEVTDKRGKVWEYTYDSSGNVLTKTNPLNKVWTYAYDGDNNMLSAEDPLSNETEFTYDGDGNLLEVEDPLNRTSVTNTYNGYGEVIESEDALGRTTEIGYDSYGNVNATEDPSGVTSSATHNLLGKILTVTDGASSTFSIDYDEWMRPLEVTEPGSAVSTIDYDAESNVTGATDALSRTGTRAYDDLGRLTSTTNANSETQTYAYDFVSRLTSVTNARSYARTYTYTDRGEVATLTLPDSSVEAWTYNGSGAVTVYTNPLSQAINYAYDDAGRHTGVDYPTGTDTSFSYDDAGRPTAMVDSTGTSSWTYNAASEVTQLSTPQGVIDYAYNLAGQRTSMDQGLTNPTTYAYDAGGRVDSITDPFSDVVSYTYDGAGRLSRRDLGNGTYELFVYDSRSRVTSIDVKNSSNALLHNRDYVYDAASQITQVVEGAVTTDYDYDDIGQLIEEDKSTGYLANYTYDANGNRATRTINSVTETYTNDSADKLTAISGGSDPRTFTYDAAGRTTAITRPSSDVTAFVYDYDSRITSISRPGMTTNTFVYNGLDTRVEKSDSSGSLSFLRDGAYVTNPVLSDGATIFTTDGEMRTSSTTTYHSGLKNTDLQTSSSQLISATKIFDAFGNELSSTGSWNSQFSYAGRFGYQHDAETGFKLLGHRYYDSSTGRFLTRDPIKKGNNWYAYCASSPCKWSDPTGLDFHNPTRVKVSPGFKGKVWGVGEIDSDPNADKDGKTHYVTPVQAGETTHTGMDTDYVTVIDKNGDSKSYFLPGAPRYIHGGSYTYEIGEDGVPRLVLDANSLPLLGSGILGTASGQPVLVDDNDSDEDGGSWPWDWRSWIRKDPIPANRAPSGR